MNIFSFPYAHKTQNNNHQHSDKYLQFLNADKTKYSSIKKIHNHTPTTLVFIKYLSK